MLRHETRTIATAKQSCVSTAISIYSYENAQKLATELLLLAQICTKSFVGWGFAFWSLQRFPDSLAGLGGLGMGKEGKRREGREGRGWSPGMPKSRVGKPRIQKWVTSS